MKMTSRRSYLNTGRVKFAMTFHHPDARDAKVWQTGGIKGKAKSLLVIITELELDKDHKKFDAKKNKALSEAAKTWLEAHSAEATDYLLMSRPKVWEDDEKD